MSVSQLYRWAGVIGIVAGGLNIMVEFAPASLGRPLNLLVVLLGLWVLAAIYVRQRDASGILGAIGYLINSLGLALLVGLVFTQVFVLAALDTAFIGELFAGTLGLAALVSLVIFTVGVILFGVATFRAAVFVRRK